ncbi:MAG: AbrB/MazE/SpoVT family DNA-binding domain-containing protein [Candidatus Thermoplasmatota archaeon]
MYYENAMETVSVSRKYQIVIPKEIREKLHIVPGKKLVVIEKDGITHLIPIENLKELRGKIPKISTKNLRDEGERFS